MSLLLLHLIFVTLLLDDNVHPDILKSTNRTSLTGVVNRSSPTGVVNRPHLLSNYIHFNLANSSFFTSFMVMSTCMVMTCTMLMLSILKSSKTSKPSMSSSLNHCNFGQHHASQIWSILTLHSWWAFSFHSLHLLLGGVTSKTEAFTIATKQMNNHIVLLWQVWLFIIWKIHLCHHFLKKGHGIIDFLVIW